MSTYWINVPSGQTVHLRSEAETGCQKDQKKDGSGGRQPLVPGIAAAFGFVLFVCHSAHLSVM